uniref:DUF4228 domain protein n=1 Tax=Zea mays TaxID=4577 RepID=B6U3N2_MAIZE|nr:hypothetical protein [Zea mays]
MGNLVSQCVANGAGARPLVVEPDGSRTLVDKNTGVAELMIDAPGHVVARATDVARERRVRAMAADELLRAGVVYLLVPAGRAGARLGDREVEAIARLVCGKKNSTNSGGKRVFPDVNGEGNHDHGFGPRQWQPALQTIYEA